MAGSERSGPGSASATILEGAPWILTPTERTSRQALARVDALVRLATGRAPQRMSPDAHDRFAAYVSHAAHAVAYALAASARRELGADIEDAVGGSYRSLARIARSDPRFWATILCDNAAHVSDALEDVILHMTTLRRHIEIGDVEAVRQHLAAGTAQATADG
jgi:prephenate dehydrogenase